RDAHSGQAKPTVRTSRCSPQRRFLDAARSSTCEFERRSSPVTGVSAATKRARRPWYQRHACALGLLGYSALAFVWFGRTWVDPLHRHAGMVGDPESYMFA